MHDALLDGLDGLLVTTPVNILYLSGFVGVSHEEREAYLLVTPEADYLFTHALYKEQAEEKRTGRRTIVEISPDYPLSRALADTCRNKRIHTLGYEDGDLTVAEYTKLKQKLSATLVAAGSRVETLRMTKTLEEQRYIARAADVTDQCFKFLLHRIRPGTTEARLAWDIEGFLRARGGGLAFDPIVAVNEHSSQPHYQARSSNPLRKHSVILLDFGARVNGYCADMTRVVFLGTPKDIWVKAYNATLSANETALGLLRAGERNGAVLDEAASRIITDAGYASYPHALGHAVGLAIHEAPRLTVKKEEMLRSHMVVTVEPGVYVEGSYGMRIEDLVLVKDRGISVYSKSTKALTVL